MTLTRLLTAETTPLDAHLAHLLKDPSGTPADRKVTLAVLAASAPWASRYATQADADPATLAADPAFTGRYLQYVAFADLPAELAALPAWSPGDPIRCLNVQPGSYTRTTALTVPDGVLLDLTGVKITIPAADAVGAFILGEAFWSEGGTIDGDGAKATDSFAVYGTELDDVNILGLTILDWHGVGVRLRSCRRPLVEDMRVDTVTRTSTDYGAAIQLTYPGTAVDTIDPVLRNNHTSNCAGSGQQVDGDWDRTDWRTAGAKARNLTVDGGNSHDNDFAGLFVNSGFEVIVLGFHGDDNGDYGIGLEYCRATAIAASTAKNNGNNGFSIYNANDKVTIADFIADGNTGDGVQVLWNETVVGDTATTDVLLSDGQIFDNTAKGARLQSVNGGAINDCILSGNAENIYAIGCSDISVDGGQVRNATGIGARFINVKRPTVNSDVFDNGDVGVRLEGAVGAVTEDADIGGSIHGNGKSGIEIASATYVVRSRIGAKIFDNAEFGIAGTPGAAATLINGADVYGNTLGGILGKGTLDWEVEDTHVDQSAASTIAVDFGAAAGNSPTRYRVRGGHFKSASGPALRVSCGSGALVAAGDLCVVADVDLEGTPDISFDTMGTTTPLQLDILWTGNPEGTVYAGVGSVLRRTDGGAGTTLNIKESGLGNIGWVAYAGVGASLAVRHGSGRYYTTPASTLTTGTLATDQLRAVPLFIPKAGTFDRIGVEVTAAGAAGTIIRLGIYADDGTGVPGALVVDLGTVAGDAIAVPELTISQAVTPGIFWLAAVAQLGIPTTRVVTGMSSLLGYAAAPTSNQNAAVHSGTATAGALPASFGTPTFRGDGPRVFVRTV